MKSLVIFLVAGMLASGLVVAASIPTWLDDAISHWNKENAEIPIQFLDIKDSFVWYAMPKADALPHAEIRARMYAITEANGYRKTVEEELITTGKPPSLVKPYQAKKCWTRSFTLEVDVAQQRLLTTNLCEDTTNWYMGFRILQ